MDALRLCDVLEKHLLGKTWMIGDEYSICDMICFPWFRQLQVGYKHPSGVSAAAFLSIAEKFPNCVAWSDRIGQRPAVQRGLQVCDFVTMKAKPWLEETSC